MSVLLGQFAHSLIDSGLMSPDGVQAVLDSFPPDEKPNHLTFRQPTF